MSVFFAHWRPMLSEIPAEEFTAALDACAASVLWEAGVEGPPVDALIVAQRLGLVVARDDWATCRARFVRLAGHARGSEAVGTIVVGPAERPERQQWAVAHEIGESVAHRVFEALGVRCETTPEDTRELVANHLANCLLLPRRWLAADGRAADWDLAALKELYVTASHELVARRMLEMREPIVITLFDLGCVRWRRSNLLGHVPPLLPEEHEVWQRSHASGLPTDAALDPAATGLERVRAWPIHEPGWNREILRSEIADY